MGRLDEVKAFARDFINGNQTRERRTAIQSVYFQLTGERLRTTCGTCFIEALYKILKIMEKQPCRYKLKKGAVLQPFGEGLVTSDNLTDELAEKCLRTIRGAASLFAELPADAPQYIDPKAPKIVDAEPVKLPADKAPEKVAAETENKVGNIPAPNKAKPKARKR